MRALILESPTDPKSLKLIDIPLPEPGPGEVRVKMLSIGLNRGDLLYCQNRYFIKPEPHSRIGFEAAGIIDALPTSNNEETSHFNIGDRIAICPMSFDVQLQGCLAEYGIYKQSSLIPSPTDLASELTGAIWMAYFTAWGGLISAGKLVQDETVVITAASSSVGIAAIQIANMTGAVSIATTTSEEKAQQLKKLGAAHVIILTKEDDKNLQYADQVRKITNGKGSDLVFDAVAGPGTHGLVKASKQEGRIIIQGMLDRRPMDIHAGVLMKRGLTLKGYTVDQTLSNKTQKQHAINAISQGISAKKLSPVIAERFSLKQYKIAFERLASNRHIGKIVIMP